MFRMRVLDTAPIMLVPYFDESDVECENEVVDECENEDVYECEDEFVDEGEDEVVDEGEDEVEIIEISSSSSGDVIEIDVDDAGYASISTNLEE